MVSAYLNALKNDKNLSIKDISNLSGIPTSTLLKKFDDTNLDSLAIPRGAKRIHDRASEKVPVRIPCAEYHLRHRNYYHFNFLKTY